MRRYSICCCFLSLLFYIRLLLLYENLPIAVCLVLLSILSFLLSLRHGICINRIMFFFLSFVILTSAHLHALKLSLLNRNHLPLLSRVFTLCALFCLFRFQALFFSSLSLSLCVTPLCPFAYYIFIQYIGDSGWRFSPSFFHLPLHLLYYSMRIIDIMYKRFINSPSLSQTPLFL